MKKDLMAYALIMGLGIATLGGCTTLTDLTPEERAALQAKQRAGKVDHISFEDLKGEFDTTSQQDPQ